MTLTRLAFAVSSSLVLGCAACSDDAPTQKDAAVDMTPDPCAPDVTFTGEFVDWDSTTQNFRGIFGATFTHRGDPSKTTSTAPNGRFLMCIPAGEGLVDITPMSGSDYIAGTVVVEPAVLAAGPMQSYRSFTPTRAAQYGFNAAEGHVYVHIHGEPRDVALGTTSGIAQTYHEPTWSFGANGNDVYLGNLTVSPSTSLSISGDSIEPEQVPLAAGKFTYVTAVAR